MYKFNTKQFKKLRLEHGMNQADLARALIAEIGSGSRQIVRAWEIGRSSPSIIYMMALSKIFGKKIEWFFN